MSKLAVVVDSEKSDQCIPSKKEVAPCARCGTSERYVSGGCKKCIKADSVAWRAKNTEKSRANSAAWAAANPDRKRKTNSAWTEANPEKVKARQDLWKSLHPDRKKEIDANWYARNKEKKSSTQAIRYSKNPDLFREKSRAYWSKNSELKRIHCINRRARKLENGGKLSKGLAEKLFKLQSGMCPCCKQPLGDDYQLDHIMPLALGGSNTDDNMQLLRKVCNNQKSAKHPINFMQSRGYLL